MTAATRRRRGFTLLEVLLTTALMAGLLSAVVSVYAHAMRLRDRTAERAEAAGLELRALNRLRRDLRNAAVGEGRMIGLLQGADDAAAGGYPGWLTFTTTTGRLLDDELGADVQTVAYFVEAGVRDDTNPRAETDTEPGGVLVRTVERNLLAPEGTVVDLPSQPLLDGVSAMTVGFYDGDQWLDQWDSTVTTGAVPIAVRVRLLREEAGVATRERPPLDVVVAWTMNPVTPEAEAGEGTPQGSPEGERP